jgi:hypothetical protein
MTNLMCNFLLKRLVGEKTFAPSRKTYKKN